MWSLTWSSATYEDMVGIQQHPGTTERVHIDPLIEKQFGTPRVSMEAEEAQVATLKVCEESDGRQIAVDFTKDVDAERSERRGVVLGPE